jgi:hypothetical protein
MPRKQSAAEARSTLLAQDRALRALCAGATIEAAARAAGRNRQTLHRWMSGDPKFVAALDKALADLRDVAQVELKGLVREAVGTLRELMTSADAPAAVRLQAASKVLDGLGVLSTKVELEHSGRIATGPIQVREEIFGRLPAELATKIKARVEDGGLAEKDLEAMSTEELDQIMAAEAARRQETHGQQI